MKTDPEPVTDRVFYHRVHAAAASAWWVFLVGYVILMAQYLVYLWAIPARPEWLLALWGPGFEWSEVQRWWMAGTIVFKITVWTVAMVALWLSLWARRLKPTA